MNRFSLSKSMAFVFLLVGVCYSYQAHGADVDSRLDADRKRCEDKGWVFTSSYDVGGRAQSNCAPNPETTSKLNDCRAALAEITKAKGQFMAYCQDEEGSSSSSMNAKHADLVKCSERLSECTQVQTESLPFSGMTSMLGSAGMGDFMPPSSGTCSKYTQDKLDSLLKEAKRDKTQVQKDLEKVEKEILDNSKKGAEAREKIQEDFVKQGEDYDKMKTQSAEDKRNTQAAYQKQLSEAEAAIRNMRTEIATLQRKQKLLIEQRKIQIAAKASRMLSFKATCNAETTKQFAEQRLAGSQARAVSIKRDKQAFYTSCMEGKMDQFKMEDAQFPVAMEEIDETVGNKMADLEAAEKSIQSLKSMYAQQQAQADQSEQKADSAFAQRQAAALTKMQELTQQIQQQSINDANILSRAKSDVFQANNELAKYQGQTAIGDKTPTQVKSEYLTAYTAAREKIDYLGCDRRTSGSSASGDQSSATTK